MDTTRPSEWWFIDVISSAAIRGPEIDDNTGGYAYDADRDLMREKIKVVLRAAVAQNCRGRLAAEVSNSMYPLFF